MLLYLDTSSLVKLYVEEEKSDFVSKLVGTVEIIATSIVAYAEARAAFARRFRENAFTLKEYIQLKAIFDEDWNNYFILNITGNMVKMAGNLAEKHLLRGFDSIHLASALTLKHELGSSIIFSCFDNTLKKASEHEGMEQS